MASKSFTLAESPEGGGKSACAKLGICACVLGFIGLLGFAGYYVYKTYGTRCSYPDLDEYGLSNWTQSGVDEIAFSCFPGYYLEGESSLETSKCVSGMWDPLPPACNSLPIRIDCQVNNQSLTGNVTMWQSSINAPTHIYGLINYSRAVRPQGHLSEYVIISKKTCNVSHVIPSNISELDPEHTQPRRILRAESNTTTTSATITTTLTDSSSEVETGTGEDETKDKRAKVIRVHFHSDELKAYKKTEVFFNFIFVDSKTTATLVSVHQHNRTLVQTHSNPIHSLNETWNWDKETKGGMKLSKQQ